MHPLGTHSQRSRSRRWCGQRSSGIWLSRLARRRLLKSSTQRSGGARGVTPNNAMHLTGNSRLRPLLPAGDRERWASSRHAAQGEEQETVAGALQCSCRSDQRLGQCSYPNTLTRRTYAMKLRFGTRSWLIAAWILGALLSGPAVATSIWLLAAAAGAGFVVLPDGAPRFSGPQGRESDVTELLATHEQT